MPTTTNRDWTNPYLKWIADMITKASQMYIEVLNHIHDDANHKFMLGPNPVIY